jgi:hypothetical protein
MEEWRQWTAEMRQSAAQIALASRGGEEIPILTAAQRLSASCVQCHEVFRH